MIVGIDCSSRKWGICILPRHEAPEFAGGLLRGDFLEEAIHAAINTHHRANAVWVLARSLEMPRTNVNAHTISLLNVVEGLVRASIFSITKSPANLVSESSMRSLIGYQQQPRGADSRQRKREVERCFRLYHSDHPILTKRTAWLDDALDAWAIARGFQMQLQGELFK
jgi:hypothetical protein